ncbi:uncharacterized protein LOC135128794 [Zophobas morio]|uniref:uncharacterized protein LOC135128794 n=1 Tax=Zophobas morio TaxID=2755281 RepID=UPI003082C22E
MLLYDVIIGHVRPYISDLQHGFLNGRSVETNLCTFTQFVSESFDAKCTVDCIYTDFSKAFDRLDHSKLIAKLDSFGHRLLPLAVFSQLRYMLLLVYRKGPFLDLCSLFCLLMTLVSALALSVFYMLTT